MWTARVFGAKQRRTNTEEESRDEAEIPRRFPISKWGSKKTTNQRAMDRAAIVDYTDRQAQSPEPLLPNNTVKLPPIRQNKLPPIQRNKTAEETAWGKLKNKLEVAVKKAAVDEGELGTIPDGIRKLVIHPDNPRKMAWDLFIGVCIMYSATTIPYRLAFDAVASLSRPDTVMWKLAEYFIDLLFFIDIIFSFFTGYWATDGDGIKIFVGDLEKIRQTYVGGWFIIDFASTVPWSDLIGLFTADAVGHRMAGIKIVRLLRMLRLIKMMRLLRLKRKVAGANLAHFMRPAVQKLISLMIKIMFIAHIISCFWIANNTCYKTESSEENWVDCGLIDSRYSRYLASFYWTIATMMAVGYGDISAQTPIERLIAIVAQISGAVCFGFVIVKVTDIVETVNPHATELKQKMDEIREYMRERQLSQPLQRAIREHFTQYYTRVSVFSDLQILSELPYIQRAALAQQSHGRIINICPLLKGMDVVFLADLAERLKPQHLEFRDRIAADRIISEQIYFIELGRMSMWFDESEDGAETEDGLAEDEVCIGVLGPGSIFELANAMAGEPMLCDYVAVSVCDIWWVDRMAFISLLTKHHDIIKKLQDYAQTFQELIEKVYDSETIKIEQNRVKSLMMMNSNECVDASEADIGAFFRLNVAVKTHEHHILTLRYATRTDMFDVFSSDGGSAPPSTLPGFGGAPRSRSMLRRATSTVNEISTIDWAAPWTISIINDEESSYALFQRGIFDSSHKFRICWDLFVDVLIIMSMILMPVRLGFDVDNFHHKSVHKYGNWKWLSVYDWVLDVAFGLDILVQFRTTYKDQSNRHVTVPEMIAAHYVYNRNSGLGWFWIDFFSWLPLNRLLLQNNLSSLKMVRAIRLIRLIRILRVVKLVKLKGLDTDFVEMHINVARCTKLIAVLCFVAHMFGCFWSMTSAPCYTDDKDDDVGCDTHSNWWVADGSGDPNYDQYDADRRYLASLYWAFTTMTTVGYGDILPTNDTERMYATIIMVLGSTVFGYVVGSVSAIANNQNSAFAREGLIMHQVQFHFDELHAPKELREAVKHTVDFILSRKSAFNEERILYDMPADLYVSFVISPVILAEFMVNNFTFFAIRTDEGKQFWLLIKM